MVTNKHYTGKDTSHYSLVRQSTTAHFSLEFTKHVRGYIAMINLYFSIAPVSD